MMAKQLEPVSFDLARFQQELTALDNLLKRRASLKEREVVLPFFRNRHHLAAALGSYSSHLTLATELAFEFPLFGDFTTDLILGSRSKGAFCLVEFEEGSSDSIFKKQPKRGEPEWSARFEHGFSQLVDWFYRLADLKGTDSFCKAFGYGHVHFSALLVIGRDAGLNDAKRTRLRWRTEKVLIDSHAVNCVTFDELAATLRTRFAYYIDTALSE